MTRSILIAALAGLLTAVLASYFLTAPARQDRAATLAGPDNAVSRITNAAEAWPICSTMAAMVETPDWAALDPDFARKFLHFIISEVIRHHESHLENGPTPTIAGD